MVQRNLFAAMLLFSAGCAYEVGDSAPGDIEAAFQAAITSSGGNVTGTFTTLSYNIAGLLEPISGSNPSANTPIISCLIRDYDIVEVQEDFNYHAALYDSCDNHTFRSSTSGGMGIGDGLNLLSNFSYTDFERVTWTNRSGSDALTPKGFTMARVRLAEGTFLDVYNLHAQSEITEQALANSRSNMLQLLGFIESRSAGNAVIVMGDTNTRYTRVGQNVRELLNHGFRDVWIQLMRAGNVPALGSTALTACTNPTSGNCEIVDKVFYRSNRRLTLTPTAYQVEKARFVDANGVDLSDHWPVRVTWSVSTASDRRMSDFVGGASGMAFNDLALMPANPVVATATIRAGSRVDQVGLTWTTGYPATHGGGGGTLRSLTLASNEYLTSAQLCTGSASGSTRIFYAKLTTNTGRTVTGGATTSSCKTYTAPSGWQISGFHGRSGTEVDTLGVIYAPRLTGAAPGPAQYAKYVNRNSNLCLDIDGGTMADGRNVFTWTCGSANWQRWNYDAATGLIRSFQNPRFCLDNSGSYGNGANIVLWTCSGNANQQFTIDASGAIRSRSNPSQVLDALNMGTTNGTDVVTWTDSGGNHERWNLVP